MADAFDTYHAFNTYHAAQRTISAIIRNSETGEASQGDWFRLERPLRALVAVLALWAAIIAATYAVAAASEAIAMWQAMTPEQIALGRQG